MEFTNRPYLPGETISAIATPPGEGGIAVIRVSGTDAFSTISKIFSGDIFSYKSHTAHFGTIRNFDGEKVDEVLLLIMKGPRSYTGEDTIEIQCHGGSFITRALFQLTLQAGARPALPGEFTFKAFMNGKLDLARAEAVQKLIGARSARALHAADQQLSGHLSEKIRSFQKGLFDIAAIFEAWVDFPEEGLEFASFEQVTEQLETICLEMEKLRDTFHEGKRIHDGFTLALIGAPNAGKSSLMNALLGSERAIVTPIAGTTRDLLEEDILLGNLHFKLIDTAGIRQTDELVEQEGVRRSYKTALDADILLCVLDGTQAAPDEILELIKQRDLAMTLLVFNKSDLDGFRQKEIGLFQSVAISAKEKVNLTALKEKIESMLWKNGAPSKEEIVLTNMRHHSALSSAIISCRKVIAGLQEGLSAEFVASDMRTTLKELGAIIGVDVTEELLSSIFSKFCVGK